MNVARRQFVGVDLGQAHDPTAIAVVDEATTYLDGRDPVTWETGRALHYELRFLERVALGTPYPAVAERVSAIAGKLGGGVDVVVDGTGVGRPVVDLLRGGRGEYKLVPVLITGGTRVTYTDGWWHVPKRDLVAGLVVVFQRGDLHISARLQHADALVNELTNFGVKLTAAGNDVYGNARDAAHDDLVLAVALAQWRAAAKVRRGRQSPIPMVSW